jgi:hypothetical protein
MVRSLESLSVTDGEPISAEHIPVALTAGDLVYDDGAEQTFEASGATTYVDHGKPTHGEWYLDGSGRFCSFWPPSYRACYELLWLVEDGAIAGMRFVDTGRGDSFVGRYR